VEKVLYVLWRDPGCPGDELRAALVGGLAPRLLALGARSVQVNVADAAVEPAAGLKQTTAAGPIDAVVGVWVDTAIDDRRRPFDEAVAAVPGIARTAAYLVTESEPLRNSSQPPDASGRTPGFAQLVFLRCPSFLTHEAWVARWHDHHTDVALDTQSTFRYVQNVVTRRLTPDGPAIDAMVEECFPAGAMSDPRVFFDAEGDHDKLKRNLATMVESVSSFLDLDYLDVVPTSQYLC
jgi:hypothetical protein